ncbi:MFS transporter [Actinomycetospora termitidis]|uniref:Aromatic acid/H+ symport family MFS transporter n=1 Tax=Actinomycetospora termitidis TaxID=3053470 RepID=A0ABT7MCJ0_9PSEU|nr:aromatic acid/H+ symport family MFS transporter [Actinomycetospora sp. Odt1-22]MDL5158377.1 aromatic acid/H+ symport family MFS transporter [Actinomycetospora sp. Odt1-22]
MTNPSSTWVRWLAWSAVALEGYDLVVLGVVIPVLRRDPSFGASAAALTTVTTVGLLGVMVGALAVGPVSDVWGRRRTVVVCVLAFSILGAACALATGPVSLGVLRFLAGVPLGGVLPVALAMTAEHAPPRRGNSATTVLMTGYHVGAVAASLLGALLVTSLGWQFMFVVGAVPALVLVPLMLRRLPADTAPVARESGPTARRNPVGDLFRGGFGVATVAFWVASFMGLLLVYGLNTWLPEIMRLAGYELTQALFQLLALNVGAVIGLLIGGRVADRVGVRPATIAWFAVAAVFLALLSIPLPGATVYVAILLAGVFVFSSQVLVYAWVGRIYPAAVRGTALGSASGVGRLGAISGPAFTGALVAGGVAYPWGFYFFALVAALGAVAVVFVRRTEPAGDLEGPSAAATAPDRAAS